MKKSTCKLLIGIGILLFLIGLFSWFFFFSAIILFLIAWTKWNSEDEHINLRRRTKVNVHINGKMKDLK